MLCVYVMGLAAYNYKRSAVLVMADLHRITLAVLFLVLSQRTSANVQVVSFEYSEGPTYGQLDMTFNGSVMQGPCDTAALTFQNKETLPTISYRLQYPALLCTHLGSSTDNIRVRFASEDYLIVLTTAGLWDSTGTAYLSIASNFILDSNGNDIQAVPNTSAIQPRSFISNIISPEIRAFEADMNAGILTLNVDQLVNTRVVNFSRIFLQDSLSDINMHTLTGGVSTNTEDVATEVAILLTNEDLNSLKIRGICQSEATCYATFMEGTLMNPSGTDSIEFGTVQVLVFERDTTPVIIESFLILNWTRGSFILSFSEPVNSSAADESGTYFTSQPESNTSTVAITEPFTTASDIQLDSICEFYIHPDDVTQMERTPGLCRNRSSCFLALPSHFITDTSDNAFRHSLSNTSSAIGFYQPDTIDATSLQFFVISFSLDLNSGVLQLNMSDYVNLSTFQPTAITVQDKAVNSTQCVVLTDSRVEGVNQDSGIIVHIELSVYDSNRIKSLGNLASSRNNTYISVDPFSAYSVRGKPLERISAMQASFFIPDTTPPQLVSVRLKLQELSLFLTFNEPVRIPTDIAIVGQAIFLHCNESTPARISVSLNASVLNVTYPDITSEVAETNQVLLIEFEKGKLQELEDNGIDDSSRHDVFITIIEGSNIVDYSDNILMPTYTLQAITDSEMNCPSDMYADVDLGECKPCSEVCLAGCTGPLAVASEGGCNNCTAIVVDPNGEQVPCLQSCPVGTYLVNTTTECLACNSECLECYGPLSTDCTQCVNANMSEDGLTKCVPLSSECQFGMVYDIERGTCILSTDGLLVIVILVCGVMAVVVTLTLVAIAAAVLYKLNKRNLRVQPAADGCAMDTNEKIL